MVAKIKKSNWCLTVHVRATIVTAITSIQYISSSHNTIKYVQFHQQQSNARVQIHRLQSDNANILSLNFHLCKDKMNKQFCTFQNLL